MKKTLFVSVLSAAMAALLLAGCGRINDVPSGDGQIVRSSENTEQENAENLQDKEEELPGSTGEDFLSAQEPSGEDGNLPVVYMTTEISAESLMAVYDALGASPSGRIAIKLSTGEPGSNYLRTDLIGDFVMFFDEPSIVECNTAYGGSRSNTAMHYQVAEDHGYTAIADVDIMDENGSMSLDVEGGDNLTENYVGVNFANYDYYVILSHFKGHAMAGFGGAIKNISIGIASSEGKAHIHSGGTGGSMWGGDQDAFLESMAEAGKSVVDNRMTGVFVGLVTENYEQTMPGRVCVRVPVRDKRKDKDELKWARVAMPSSGKKWGHYFLPEIGDQVLLAFEQGNIEKPYIIGCIPKDANPFLTKSAHAKNQSKRIVTKNGSTIAFEDVEEGDGTNDKIFIYTPNRAHQVILDNEKNEILIGDQANSNRLLLETKEGRITISAQHKFTLSVGDNITLSMNADTGTVTLKCGKFKVEATDGVQMDTSAKFGISGGNVTMDASAAFKLSSAGLTSIGGAPIKIG